MFEDREHHYRRWSGLAVVAACALVLAPVAGLAKTAEAQTTYALVGSNLQSVPKLTELGAKPDLAMFWVGIWTKNDWGAVDRQLASANAKNVAPVIQWYYWGDDISSSCIENGCYSTLHGGWKKKSDWNAMAVTLAKKIRANMGDRPAYVILETEFNKNGVATYEPMDGYLAAQADVFRTYAPNVKLILGFGNWGWSNYKNFDRSIAKADFLGTQILRSSVRSTDTEYLSAPQRLVDVAKYLNGNFRKPVFITDSGFSTYPSSKYEGYQERVVKEIFSRMGELESAGVRGWLYRSAYDNPGMDPANYHQYAERYWGFIRSDGSWKPSMGDYVAGIKAMKASRTSTSGNVPGTHEAESMSVRSTGGAFGDSKAANGRAWNLWTNGHVGEKLKASSAGTYALTVKAKGSYAGGSWPMMVMTADGKEVGRWNVRTSTDYWSYTANVDFSTGQTRDVRIHFVNDHYDAKTGADRNLYVDLVRVGLASAPTPPPPPAAGSREAEDFRYRPVGGRIADDRASGKAAWNVWSTGSIRDTIRIEQSGRYDVTVHAKGELAGQSYPKMVLYVDNVEVGRWDVRTDRDYWSYTSNRYLAAGEHGIRVEFTNDYYWPEGGKDRNLLVDRVTWSMQS